MRELPSFTLVWLRVAVAAAALLLVLRLLGQRMPTQGPVWVAFVGMGLLNNAVPFSLFAWGQHHVASGLALILNATTPLLALIGVGPAFIDGRLSRSPIRRRPVPGQRPHGRAPGGHWRRLTQRQTLRVSARSARWGRMASAPP